MRLIVIIILVSIMLILAGMATSLERIADKIAPIPTTPIITAP